MKVMRFAMNRARSQFSLKSLQINSENQTNFTEDINKDIPDVNAMIPRCFMKKYETEPEPYTTMSECNLFQPTVTDMGICPSFNQLPIKKIMRPFYYLSTLYQTYEEDFTEYEDLKYGEDFGQSLNFFLTRTPTTPQLNLDKLEDPATFHISVTSDKEFFGMKSQSFIVKAGYKTTINVEPLEIVASTDLKSIPVSKRQCKFEDETGNLGLFDKYSQAGCVFEKQIDEVIAKCQCVPWFVPTTFGNNYTICDIDGNDCYETVLKHTKAGRNCLSSCNLVQFSKSMIVEKIDPKDVCEGKTSWQSVPSYRFSEKGLNLLFKYQKLKEWTAKPHLNETYDEDKARKGFCQYMAKNHVAEVQVKFGNKKYIRTKMGVKVSFTDRLGVFGK